MNLVFIHLRDSFGWGLCSWQVVSLLENLGHGSNDMRVGLDARLLGTRGIGRYVQGLLEGMEHLENRPEVVAFTRQGSAWDSMPDYVKVRELSPGHYQKLEQSVLPKAAEDEKCDVIHFCDNMGAVYCRIPQLVTIHDLYFLGWPGKRQSRPGIKAYGAWIYRKKFFEKSLENAKKIVCPSQSTADELMKVFSKYFRKTTVARLAAGPPFSKQSSKEAVRASDRAGLSGPFYLLPCGADQRKNLAAAFDGFMMFKKKRGTESTVLALYGMDTKRLLRHWPKIGRFIKRNDGGAVRNLGWLPDPELAALMSGARGLLFPSIDEGVGLPALEAARCGCPVITGQAPVFREYLGEAAIFIRPEAGAIAEALGDLDSSKERREELSKAGLTQSGRGSWAECAEAHVGLYRACLDGGGPG